MAWLNLVHSKGRTVLAVAGVVFAVVLVFMQLGFRGSAETSAALIYDALDFDVLIRSKRYLHLVDARSFPRSRLYQAAAVPGVQHVSPLLVDSGFWRNPDDGSTRVIMVLGVDAGQPPFFPGELQQNAALLTAPEFLLIDRQSRWQFGPQNGSRFSDRDLGVETDLAGHRVRIAGLFSLGAGFTADGTVVLSEQGYYRVFPYHRQEDVNLGLVKLAPGTSAAEVAAAMQRALPKDVEVLPRQRAIALEVDRWVSETSLGLIFQLGVGVALLVGAAIVYQVLSSDVAHHLPKYATLKAIGYDNRFLARVVIHEALLLAVAGFCCGLLVAEALYIVAGYVANVPLAMTWQRMAGVFVLSLGMCLVSALGASRKVRTADPVDLF